MYAFSMSNAAEQFISRGDYLAIECEGTQRHEWVGGQMFAMTGGTLLHNRLSFRIASHLSAIAEPEGCRTYIADTKVVTDFAAYYPDVMVVCEEQADPYFETDPCHIVEVRSKPTQDHDKREKWMAYASIPTLNHYVLVSQTERLIEHRRRTDLGWSTEVLGADDSLRLTCPEIVLSVRSMYEGLLA
jgi:Uma2 family endonuclease